jgi:hypothetical protein
MKAYDFKVWLVAAWVLLASAAFAEAIWLLGL